MGNVRLFTLEERIKIQELIQDGKTHRSIGIALNRSREAIKNEILKHGGKSTYKGDVAHAATKEKQARRTYKLIQNLTEIQLGILLDSYNQGKTFPEIRMDVNCSYYLLKKTMRRLGLKMVKKSAMNFLDKFEALETQISILFDLIEELNQKCQNLQ